ncbi:MAG: hypothetical protein IIA82_08410 [Thaumarchaeota archaeon]|nr:hypothetical protein [Nitrososphaerota archaeon]
MGSQNPFDSLPNLQVLTDEPDEKPTTDFDNISKLIAGLMNANQRSITF